MGSRRFTRLTNGFSKKLDNHVAAVALMLLTTISAASMKPCARRMARYQNVKITVITTSLEQRYTTFYSNTGPVGQLICHSPAQKRLGRYYA